jgi:hypothetical protein
VDEIWEQLGLQGSERSSEELLSAAGNRGMRDTASIGGSGARGVDTATEEEEREVGRCCWTGPRL